MKGFCDCGRTALCSCMEKYRKDRYVWIIDIGLPEPFLTKKLALAKIKYLRSCGWLKDNVKYSIYKKKIVSSEGSDK